jgi:cell division protein FtsZ
LTGVDFLACNTDAQHLVGCKTENRIQLGKNLTQGLGCGANPNDGYVYYLEIKHYNYYRSFIRSINSLLFGLIFQ